MAEAKDLSDILARMRKDCKTKAVFASALSTLGKLIVNLQKEPNNKAYTKVMFSNKAMKRTLFSKGETPQEFLEATGWATRAKGLEFVGSKADLQRALSAIQDAQNSKAPVPKVIRFYGEKNQWGCFSNFSPHPFQLKGKHWPTTEHYFQAMKFEGTEHEETVRTCKTASESKKLGRSFKLRPDWEKVKVEIMYECCLEKFKQNASIRRILLGTENAKLVEHTRNDSYWGDGGNGSGQNKLGIVLMRVRDTIRKEQEQKKP